MREERFLSLSGIQSVYSKTAYVLTIYVFMTALIDRILPLACAEEMIS